MDKQFFYYVLSRAILLEGFCYLIPLAASQERIEFEFYLAVSIVTISIGFFFKRLGRNPKRRVELIDCAILMVGIFPILAIFGSIPFAWTEWMSPIDSFLESLSDLTTTSLSLLEPRAPYSLKIWQGILMWLGGLIFLIMLVTILPQVSGCFGIDLSIHQGQTFSPILGQMKFMAHRVIAIYLIFSILSFLGFCLAGLDVFDSIAMVSRSISTGGGDFFPAGGNFWAEVISVCTMLLASMNVLLIHFIISRREPKIILRDSEVMTMAILILAAGLPIFVHLFAAGFENAIQAFHDSFFHVISFLTTTGFKGQEVLQWDDFDWFLLLMLSWCGGCMGSVTGGLKIIRILVLFKMFNVEISRTLHPRMVTSIRISDSGVKMEIVSRILSFFFLTIVVFFFCAIILSLSGVRFSTAVGMSMACLTTIGIAPGLCLPETFLDLPMLMKLFCGMILIVGRVEIFAAMILIQSILMRRKKIW